VIEEGKNIIKSDLISSSQNERMERDFQEENTIGDLYS
jgi:hypothetical protein